MSSKVGFGPRQSLGVGRSQLARISQYARRCDKIQPQGLSRRSKIKFSAHFGINNDSESE